MVKLNLRKITKKQKKTKKKVRRDCIEVRMTTEREEKK